MALDKVGFMATTLRLEGPVLVGPEDARDGAWVIDGRISYAAPSSTSDVQTLRGWVLPGLVGAHCHVGLGPGGVVSAQEAEEQARTDREHGTLLIRDAGQPGDTRWIDERDDLPRIIRAGRHIARSRRYIRNFAWEIEPDELVAHVQQEAARGDGWVKLVGDWIDRETGDLEPCWPAEAVAAAVTAAHEAGARITAHCFGEASLYDWAAAGADCIEHATGLEDKTIESFAAQGISIVPTMVNIATFPQIAAPAREKFPAYYDHMIRLFDRRYDTIAQAYEAGVPIRCGTDAGGSLPHGLVADEIAELVRAGLPPLAALDSATWSAREWLGRPGLEEGAPADLVIYAEDPREDIRVLHDPQHVVLRGIPR